MAEPSMPETSIQTGSVQAGQTLTVHNRDTMDRLAAIAVEQRKLREAREFADRPGLATKPPQPRREAPKIPDEAKVLRETVGISGELREPFASVAGKCVRQLAVQLGQRYSPERTALDRFSLYAGEDQKAALARVRRFIAEMETVLRETRGLILYGSVGTGKDHLLAAALYHVAGAGIPTAWVSGEGLFARVRDSMDSNEREDKIIQPWLSPIVLGISDPVSPRGALSDWDARVLGRLLDQRYRALRPTWLTMNATDQADAKAKLTSLIWDRFQDGAEVIPCRWPSFRAMRGKVG